MGRRAKKAPIQTKKRQVLAKRFKCPFCANEETVECKMDFKNGIGSLACRLCAASYQMPIHHLHEPVDVFSEWLDDCEAAATGRANNREDEEIQQRRYESEDDDDDEVPAASGLSNNKAAAAAASKNNTAAAKGKDDDGDAAGGEDEGGRLSYTALGLDDSDDDSDDD
mmetsp:Transcript_132141/g.196866  ORF Transcript_132141/g.196866 Transcript_132141/m.196866 type:complete len:168 (-) Transcript_132141:32-535(-)|eukprot:CAMPEP_0117029642 /NCGR_PEP_ID=MMETSP0472-20121206/21447_1 /TAXON_ID=693140 ORGANISM="Tiarina fusus, Strain LIS" /NCGR_SAMPLE_ID=MMETSP0472 /ASSEMBLY_ACC=CAM_ASM_000603 /LENGTH=167 /DNA_ID=CAMNT_0004737465 /DNA_START=110 /DNA_END=613 /DNA_ORIENTATION=-